MSPTLLAAALRLDAVVDRVEGEVAVIEWRVGALADVPLGLLPPDTGEGDRLVVEIAPAAGAEARAITPSALDLPGDGRPPVLLLPPEVHLAPGLPYRIDFQPAAAGPAGWTHPSPDQGVSP